MKGTLTIVGNRIERTDLSIQLPSSALVSMTSSLVPPYPLTQIIKSAEVISRIYICSRKLFIPTPADCASFLALIGLSKNIIEYNVQIDRLSAWFPHVPVGLSVDCFVQSGQLVVLVSSMNPSLCLNITTTVPSIQAIYVSLLNMISSARIFDNVVSIS